jgi:hypothetical protein
MVRGMMWAAVAGIGFGIAGLLCALVFLPAAIYPPLSEAELRAVPNAESRIQLQQAQGQLENNARATLLQAVAGVLVAVGAMAAWYQVRVNRDGQITDRFTRAVDQLGNDNVDVRIGGIYALERIAKNSADDRPTVQVVIGSYVRTHAPWQVGSPGGPAQPTSTVDHTLPSLRMRAPDVQTAMVVLCRRPPSRKAPRLYLSRVDLRGIQLFGRTLTNALVNQSNLARADLPGTRLDRSDFKGTDLRDANLERASLRGASLRDAQLAGSNVRAADLREADLRGADMRAEHLAEALLTGARADETTIWPDQFTADIRRGHGILEPATTAPLRSGDSGMAAR